ncbi:MAG: TetR/AcrR family transcriptional regulator [Oculatellaceae cyanobacterium Prado106]|jgi:TetR/AcrR family transcriptional repressor of nem operon|nr:TetR/AcrR family transcriptional regulator [Oculatellaceae cyanobacterium Prado106]
MPGKTALKEDTKLALIKAGRRIIVEKGYNHTGIQEILLEVGVPKGSFYHFFSSKEEFGLAIIDYDSQQHDRIVEQYLGDTQLTPLNRIKRYFTFKLEEFETLQYREGCLFGNLSQEMADQNDRFRLRLQEAVDRWRDQFAECIQAAQDIGEISTQHSAQDLATFCLNSWEGALLQMKLSKSDTPLKNYIQFMFGTILHPAQ